jgi:hypothetical protein
VRADLPRGTVTFLFTDVEASTRLLRDLGEDDYADMLAEHRRMLRSVFELGRLATLDEAASLAAGRLSVSRLSDSSASPQCRVGTWRLWTGSGSGFESSPQHSSAPRLRIPVALCGESLVVRA